MGELSRNSGSARTPVVVVVVVCCFLLFVVCCVKLEVLFGPRLEPGVCLELFLSNQQVLVRS
jgi:hypothetical protein